MSQVEELINQSLKEQMGRITPTVCDRASHPFTPELLSIIVPRDVKT